MPLLSPDFVARWWLDCFLAAAFAVLGYALAVAHGKKGKKPLDGG